MSFLDNHRGPFRLIVTRPFVTKKGFYRSEWLSGSIEREDVESDARALLTDPRDTITSVYVWSEGEDCFIGGYSKESTT